MIITGLVVGGGLAGSTISSASTRYVARTYCAEPKKQTYLAKRYLIPDNNGIVQTLFIWRPEGQSEYETFRKLLERYGQGDK